MYVSGWLGFFFLRAGALGVTCVGIVVVEGQVSIGVGYIRITYIPGSVGCGSLRYCGATLRV